MHAGVWLLAGFLANNWE